MKHASLFSGIGGFDLAAQWMGWENVFHCEWDKKCQALLKKRFPGSVGFGDIKEADFTPYAKRIDIISGGFPCQPFSTAGKRKGKEDERHLWPEMLRAIREIQPRWVVGENVYGLINWSAGMVFNEVQVDLEAAGYEVWPYVLPACAINAPHRRDRVWFVAHSNSGSNRNIGKQDRKEDSLSEISRKAIYSKEFIGTITGNDTNPKNQGSQRSQNKGEIKGERPIRNKQPTGLFCTEWENFPTQPPLCRGNDGLSNRVDRLKQLGNAIVPQVALQIFKTIEQYEHLFTGTELEVAQKTI